MGKVIQGSMETSIKCVKYTLFLFNLLFSLSGLFLIVTGGVVQGAYSQYLDFLGDSFFSTPVFLIIVGCIIFFVAFFGCCGAIKENHCMTLTFRHPAWRHLPDGDRSWHCSLQAEGKGE